MGTLKIGGDLRPGAASTGHLNVLGHIASLTIDGDIIAPEAAGEDYQVYVSRGIDLFRVGGSIRGNTNHSAIISAGFDDLAIGTLLVGGNMDHATIIAEGRDTRIDQIKVQGDWIASRVAIDTSKGPDQIFGTDDDLFVNPSPDDLGRLGSLKIEGQLLGTVAEGDSYRIMVRHIGKIQVGGVLYPLTTGSDDLALGSTPDVHASDLS